MDWSKRFEEFENVTRRLEPGAAIRRSLSERAVSYAEEFLEGIGDCKTFSPDRGRSETLDMDLAEGPAEFDGLLRDLLHAVDSSQINPASGGHLGYIPGGGIYPSAIGDFLADITNRYSGIHYASPGAVRMEQELVAWMTRLVGYPQGSGGDLTSGGSTANLSAIVTARDAMGIRAGEIEKVCVYMTRQVHHCVDKSLRVAGMMEAKLRFVPMDARHRMDDVALEEMITADRSRGLKPWLVVASAGTTDTGAVDPFLKIAAITRKHDLWFHVDAAYGGFFLLCPEGREALRGLDAADSIVMDPHKGLFLPYGSGAVLVRDVDQLARAHSFQADYLQDATARESGYSPAELSAELTRPFRGLRLWLPLKLFGLGPFRAALAEKIWLARYFHEKISAIGGFEAGPWPDLSVVTFRYLPREGDADEFNRRLLKAVLDDGRIFISSTLLDGWFTMRAAILHYRTHRREIDHLLGVLTRTATQLRSGTAQSSPSQ